MKVYNLNCKKNGKGKEYLYGNQLIFEDEYLNGKRNGKGKKYDYRGNLKFEGEYLNGIKWIGKITKYVYGFYNEDNLKLKFEGEYLGNYFKKGKEYINGRLE